MVKHVKMRDKEQYDMQIYNKIEDRPRAFDEFLKKMGWNWLHPSPFYLFLSDHAHLGKLAIRPGELEFFFANFFFAKFLVIYTPLLNLIYYV